MPDADKLFEELGYEKEESLDHIGYIKTIKDCEYRYQVYISFDLLMHTFCSYAFEEPFTAFMVDMQELKAINKKCEELRLDRRKYKYRKRTY